MALQWGLDVDVLIGAGIPMSIAEGFDVLGVSINPGCTYLHRWHLISYLTWN